MAQGIFKAHSLQSDLIINKSRQCLAIPFKAGAPQHRAKSAQFTRCQKEVQDASVTRRTAISKATMLSIFASCYGILVPRDAHALG